jgi:two-component system nitrogen regulation sensor histidine kinase NtrY
LISLFKQTFKKYGYLLITAAWLFTISFLFSNYWSYKSSAGKVKDFIEEKLQDNEETFRELLSDTAQLQQLYTSNFSGQEPPAIFKKSFSVFIYSRNDVGNPILSFWNSHVTEPLTSDLNRTDGSYLVQYLNGFFVLQKRAISIKRKSLIVVGLFPIKWNYFLENKYLRSEFEGLPGAARLYDVSTDTINDPIRNSADKALFSIKELKTEVYFSYDAITIILRVLSVFLLFLYINFIARHVVEKYGLLKGIGFLAGFILLFRLITIYLPFPFDFRRMELFDAMIYASSTLLPSLGDLLVNSLLLFWMVIFTKTHFTRRKNIGFKVTERQSWWLHAAFLATLISGIFQLADIVQSLVTESQISFDVTDFFSLSIYSIVSFFVLGILMIAFYHATHVFLYLSELLPRVDLIYKVIMVAVIGLVILTVSPFDTRNSVNVIVLVWFLAYLWVMHLRKKDWSWPLLKSPLFIFWIMLFSFSLSALIIYQNNETEQTKRQKIAEKLALQSDPSGENLIGIAITNLHNDWLAENFHRFEEENSSRFLKDSLITENFAGYLNKFDTKIYTYDSLFHLLYNEDSTTYAAIKSLIITQGKKTSFEDLFYYEKNNLERFSYLYEKKVAGSAGNTLGHLFIVAKPKRYKSEALYPELFKQVGDISTDLNTNYAYAVYSNNKLINSFNDYNFPRELTRRQVPLYETEWRKGKERSELWYKTNNSKIVVIVKKDVLLLESITLFAYFFFTFLLIVLLFHAAQFVIRSRFRVGKIWQAFSFSLRNQIHFTIIFISLFSFIIIGIATISFFIIRFERSNTERLGRTIQVMANEIETTVNKQLTFDNISIYDLGFDSDLDKKLAEISDIHNVDVNFYDKQGNLRISTIPYVYNKGILNRKMDPAAFFEMTHNKRAEWLQEENVGKFSYLSIYLPIRSETGETFAYLNIPYLNSQRELNEEISNFLVTLINLNAFIFLLAGAIALFLANKITSSFSLISAKMREVNLGSVNEEITWKNKDEIGALVNEYNKMVKKLEASAVALARSEREGAWREMARQVAHEIKNPLTPMKLSIQHLQRAIDSGSPNVKELSERMASTLIEQIDQLSKIAADFSQFANIGNIKPEVVNVEKVLQSLIGLYSSDGNLSLHFTKETANSNIYADKTHINRLFTNLIKNAIEASNQSTLVNIYITLKNINNEVLVSIQDNGTGIPVEMQQKIFSPNFTTKTSGTGLGLAICKAIVEKANGTIWFETEEDKGTTFFVQLPLKIE